MYCLGPGHGREVAHGCFCFTTQAYAQLKANEHLKAAAEREAAYISRIADLEREKKELEQTLADTDEKMRALAVIVGQVSPCYPWTHSQCTPTCYPRSWK